MKNKLQIFLFVNLMSLTAISQHNDCVKDANTNPHVTPSDIYEQNIPYVNIPTLQSQFINQWIYWMNFEDPNNFVWQFPIYDMGQNPGEIYSFTPGNPPLTGYMEHVNSDFYKFYYRYLNHLFNRKPDENLFDIIHPQNGWELISANLGRYPDDNTPFPFSLNTPLRSIPYLLYYNKYTGLARIYVRYGNNEPAGQGANYADIIISHQDANAASGMLRLGNGKDMSLDKPTTIARVRSRVPSPGDAQLWFSADFQMHYDPCVCEHKSTISVDFEFFNIGSLNLYGRSVTLSGDIANENIINDGANFLDFRSTFNYSTGNPSDGYIIYNYYIELINDYLNRLNAYKAKLISVNRHNANIDRYIADLESSKFALGAIGEFTEFTSPEKIAKVIKVFNKIISSGFDLGIKRQSKKKLPVPSKPTAAGAAISEMSFSGQLGFGTFKPGPIINTPGSKDAHIIQSSDKPQEFPLYNEALGIFALLEKPKITLSNKVQHHGQDHLSECQYYWPAYQVTTQWKLRENLKYVFNPVLNIKQHDIRASIEFDFHFNTGDYSNCGQIYHMPSGGVNVSTIDFDLDSTQFFIKDAQYDTNSITLSSIYVPLDAITNLVSNWTWFQHVPSNKHQLLLNTISGARLKLIVDVEFEGQELDGNSPEYTYMFTYDIDLNDKINNNDVTNPNQIDNSVLEITNDVIQENIFGSIYDYTQYSEDLEFHDIVFSGQQVEGCVKIGNHYTCKAYNNILLSGLISTLTPISVEFIAGNEIVVEPESDINTSSGDIVLRIEPVLIMSPMPPQDPLAVSTWCNSTNYKANTLRSDIAAIQDSLAQANPTPQPEPTPIEFIVFPNPTTGASQAGLVLPELSTVSISIIDITGKVQGRPVRNQVLPVGRNVLNLESEPLAPGVYFVQVVVNGEKLTQRLVKQ